MCTTYTTIHNVHTYRYQVSSVRSIKAPPLLVCFFLIFNDTTSDLVTTLLPPAASRKDVRLLSARLVPAVRGV